MTLRERIADWISGGALSEAQAGVRDWSEECERAKTRAGLSSGLAAKTIKADAAKADALRAIIACETPSANATVRRMARIAKGALE